MRSQLAVAVAATILAVPSLAEAAMIDASLIPHGTYVVKVEKIEDAQHAVVLMDNGTETELVGIGSVDFSKAKTNEQIKISVVKGKVPVFRVQ